MRYCTIAQKRIGYIVVDHVVTNNQKHTIATHMSPRVVWRHLCRAIRPRMSTAVYRSCFCGTNAMELDQGRLTVTVPNYTTQRELSRRFHSELTAIAEQRFSLHLLIEFIPRNEYSSMPKFSSYGHPEQTTVPPAPSHSEKINTTKNTLKSATDILSGDTLTAQYRFETFVVGDSNRFAYAAAQTVVNDPGHSYNPLFLYGGVGLGKTHLMMAIGHVIAQQGLRIYYTSSEEFANEIVTAIQHNTLDDLRQRFHTIDALLIDDIQFIGGHDRTEEEFFHIFNMLHTANKQIILTSDRLPREIPTLHARLRSRFEWGLMPDITPPDYPHRLAIIRKKAETSPVPLPDFALEYLARPEGNSARALEGALNHLTASARMNNGQVSMANVIATLRACFGTHGKIALSPRVVIDVVAAHFHIAALDLLGKKRTRDLAWPRQVAMYLMREETDASLAQIGAALGGRDHTTIMYGYEHVSDVVRSETEAVQEIEILRTTIRNLA